jgi:hypothetical protein
VTKKNQQPANTGSGPVYPYARRTSNTLCKNHNELSFYVQNLDRSNSEQESDNEGNPHCLTCSGLQTQIHKDWCILTEGSLPFSFTDLLQNPNGEKLGMEMQKFTVNITTTAGSELYALQKPD